MNALKKHTHKRIDQLEMAMADAVMSGEAEEIICPLEHKFVNGWYERTIFMPANKDGKLNVITSKIHNSKHEFVLSKGVVAVRINEGQWNLLVAPYYGWTYPGTRRVLAIFVDAVWTTYHKLKKGETTPEQVEKRIIKKHKHPFIEMKKNCSQLIDKK